MKLRYYQGEAIQSVIDYYVSGNKGNPIVVMAGGTGKSVVIGGLVKRVVSEYKGVRVLMVTHRKQLILQNHDKLISLWPEADVGIYSAGAGRKQSEHAIVYGGIQSMYKKAELFGHRNILFIDEVQLLSPKKTGMYMSFINDLKKINPKLKVVGFTATEWRTKGGSLLNQKPAIMTDICYRYELQKAMEEKYLTPLISKSSIVQANMAGIKVTAGEYNLKQMEAAIDDKDLTQAALDEISKFAGDRRHFLYFCAGIKHCQNIKAALHERGVDSYIISYKTPEKERDDILKYAQNATERTVIINDSILTIGTDIPNIDCIVFLRATMSSGLFYQMVVRGIRLHPDKKNCLIMDFSGNVERFGAVDLLKAPVLKENGELEAGIAPQKICPECREPVLIKLKECPGCGFEFPEQERKKHDSTSTMDSIMSRDIKPVIHEIEDVQYTSHIGKSLIPTLKVMYFDSWGYLTSEYVCFEHQGWARTKAIDWHYERVVENIILPPITVDNAVEKALDIYKKPKAIITKKNGKYLEILSYEF
ncbi:SSL2 DNA or RNA helicases of superfamily II [uncultured Caudovirales phage]|uniref:SSL2 DNA or RNA helicases of superfamily II n=1 Tax=uncultured Caudovirales phage TaxID=2100421 RepID=A0A6J5SJT4_9CAUD|nr:SSL2 DNA or RNA helicases of superfamily II [uncultured Caudovirales phage]